MISKKLFLPVVLVVALFVCGSFQLSVVEDPTYSITVKVFNIRNSKGRIQLQIYRDQASFEKEIPWKTTYISKDDMEDGSVTKRLYGFKGGIYGLALLDDEDADTVMDYGWLMPKEGFGFSNYYHTAWSKPTFHDFKFKLYGDRAINMKIRYL